MLHLLPPIDRIVVLGSRETGGHTMCEQVKNRLRLFWQAFGQLICLYPQNFSEDTLGELEKMRRLFATRSDRDALSQDWHNVGRYVQIAMDKASNVKSV